MRASNAIRTIGVLASALVVLMTAGGPGSSSVQAAGQEAVTLRIGVTLNEYSFAPEPIRIPAGRRVTLVIRNAGKVPHEFMAGREVEDIDFRQDLFADLHVNIEPAEPVAAAHGDHDDREDHGDHGDHGPHAAEHADADELAAGHDHEAAHDAPADAGHAHGAGHEHGTMVEAAAGETFLMTFTLPEDRRGEWETGCFLSGHYEAGMHGTLIVE